MRKRPLLYLASVFLAGLVYERYSVKILILLVGIFLLVEYYYARKSKNYGKAAGRSILLLSAFFLGIFHMQQETDFRAAYMSKLKEDSVVTVWGELIKMEPTEYGNRGLLSDCYIQYDGVTYPCNDIMVYTSKDHYMSGQIYKITGKLNLWDKERNQGNFDSLVYYQSLKIDFALEEEGSQCIGRKPPKWKEVLLDFKAKLSRVYEECLSQKAKGFYQAMVLGDKIQLDKELKGLFLLGGISHILAISGLHVSLLGRGIYRVFRKGGISFWFSGSCSGFLLVSYCVMVGGSASSIRAVGMMLLFFLSQVIGRSYDMLNALGAMVIFLLWGNPFLIENSGFWFSVTAILGVGIVAKVIREVMEEDSKEKKRRGLGLGSLWMSLGITLATMLVTALSYYEIPMYSLLVNFVALPFLTPVFCLAVLGGVFGLFVPLSFIRTVFAPCEWLLWFYESLCEMVAKLPGAKVICGKPELWQMILYYVLLLGGVYVLRRMKKISQGRSTSRTVSEMKKERIRKYISVVALGIACVLCIFWPKPRKFEVSFLDVGQGDGIYICDEDGISFFIDGGSTSVNNVGEQRILPFLKSKGVRSVDYWFVSHEDTDHVSGLYEVLESGYKVKHIILSEAAIREDDYGKLREKAKAADCKILLMKQGQKIATKHISFTCLGPIMEEDALVFDDVNDNSLVLLLEHEKMDFRGIFAGDISIEVEDALAERGVLDSVDLVKANHHGSNYSNGELWFEKLSPDYIVISCGKNNIHGHPGKDALERMEGCEAVIFYTMENGQITFPLIQ